jgi:N-acyl-L-homoserine lactone synthetase
MYDAAIQIAPSAAPDAEEEFKRGILKGYRFRLCTDAAMVEQALDVRRQVYVQGNGYDVPVPDAVDPRSWILLAEDTETGKACGTLRLTPRSHGPLECEEYFQLPRELRVPGAIEITRFAILPEYRKGKTFLPVVSLGLFTLTKQLLDRSGASHIVIAVKPQRLWTFQWMRFQDSGLTARYTALDGSLHHLMSYELATAAERLVDHPFYDFLVGGTFPEIETPEAFPPLGVGIPDEEPLRFAAVG